jgi:glycosyltransferase involved in cell wall biosynthesis
MKTITGVIIAKNEEDVIKDALESLSFCNQIVVVANDSEDKTKEISEKYAKVYEIKSNDFSELRNFGLSKVETDYIFYLDADERVTSELKKDIEDMLSRNDEFSAYLVNRKNFYLGENEWPYIEKMPRVFKTDKLKYWKGELHETPIYEGETGELKGYITHFTHRDLDSMLKKTIKWSTTESLLRYNTNHPKMSWWRFPRVMVTAFFGSYIKQQGFKAGTVGLIEGIFQAYSAFITYAKLWELQKGNYKKS